jgi:hypothetical protein
MSSVCRRTQNPPERHGGARRKVKILNRRERRGEAERRREGRPRRAVTQSHLRLVD